MYVLPLESVSAALFLIGRGVAKARQDILSLECGKHSENKSQIKVEITTANVQNNGIHK